MAVFRLDIGETKTLTVEASSLFSEDSIDIRPDERYTVECLPRQTWYDWWVPASPDGYTNHAANWWGQRVKGVKCFCLCGAFNTDITTGFPIGNGPSPIPPVGENSLLGFFANDSPHFYWNNHGSIKINVTRNP